MALRDCEEVVQRVGPVDCRFPIADLPAVQRHIGNWQSEIGNVSLALFSRLRDELFDIG
jgi:hypothetical protein